MNSPMILFFGNQDLEIEEKVKLAVRTFLAGKPAEDRLFAFDCSDFLKADQQTAKTRLQEFRNAVETVSFFQSDKLILVKHLEKLPKKKSPLEKIEKELAAVHLFKLPWEGQNAWFDADSLTQRPQGHNHSTAKQLLANLAPLEDGRVYLEIARPWADKLIWLQQGQGAESMPVPLFLEKKLKTKVTFEPPTVPLAPEEGSPHGFLRALCDFLADPPEGVSFLLCANLKKEEELPKELLKVIQAKGKIQKLTVAYDDFRPLNWVIGRAREKRLVFTEATADRLIEITGADFAALDQELEKLAVRLGPEAQPTAADLSHNAGHSKKFSVFLVGNFLADRDLKNALEAMESLLEESSDEAVPLLGLITYQFRKLLKVRLLMEAGLSERAIGERLGYKPWQLKDLIPQAGRFSVLELENLMIELSERDLWVKYAGKEAKRLLADLAFLVCRGRLAPAQPLLAHWTP
ncbi:MAG: DNA polymerase III subunit delta [Candidatus Lambdaproteobacteria bacterium RIFOXYD1_FULL_56_27]|uniref:DNA-directed DNA polymerase n=1 Tax=Candidatus Lambdaproteobacteria bacterium RIFOXYD2_FULL_56_26 TaxID=1817773 RepID=A0A1F6H3R1_9PROT|nr:MAG: DNA polymerase III subunit delta [Candidatus Lambdaproteobacteria bacterium RIFOXYC1_FULL_56_13]OGH05003.1 MAG: DNA polymerase III subunit delta [Candidatus Lambdaproteobacteria bacterium RIFOXYD2_FULL_56_26]OGH09468.1 MAG: DNA polymerase III subunit delta [Candidatus Lambdaproteobacteria bacterium RIFOXYD1_FULL_56_27]